MKINRWSSTVPGNTGAKTRVTGRQVLYLQRHCDLSVVAKFAGETILLQRRDEQPLTVDAIEEMLSLKNTRGWVQTGKMVEVPI